MYMYVTVESRHMTEFRSYLNFFYVVVFVYDGVWVYTQLLYNFLVM